MLIFKRVVFALISVQTLYNKCPPPPPPPRGRRLLYAYTCTFTFTFPALHSPYTSLVPRAPFNTTEVVVAECKSKEPLYFDYDISLIDTDPCQCVSLSCLLASVHEDWRRQVQRAGRYRHLHRRTDHPQQEERDRRRQQSQAEGGQHLGGVFG